MTALGDLSGLGSNLGQSMESAEGQTLVPPPPSVRCELLGACALTIGDARVLPDQELLFGYALHMAVHAGTGLNRDRVAKVMWPAQDVEASRHSLRQLTYRLRGMGMPLQSRGPNILLAADAVRLDYAPLVVARPIRDDMLAHPRLDLMPGYAPVFSVPFSRWVEDFRAEVSLGLRNGLMACIADARSRGRYREVEVFARQCLALDPLNEEATLGLAEATVLQGNKFLAMRMLHDYEREVGEPEGALQLQSTLLRRRIAERHNIYNVLSDEVEMLGRDEELELLVRLKHLARGGARQSVLLTGEAGIGKTRLATEFSKIALLHGMSMAKVDCQSGWESQPLTAATELAQALLGLPGALGCAPEAMATVKTLTSAVVPEPSFSLAMGDADAILASVRWAVFDLCEAVSQERPLLLVVDNLHWIDDLSASFLEFIQRRGARRRIMIIFTSRDAPTENRRGALTPLMATEYHVPMSPLADTEALRLVQRLADITDRPLKPNEAEECVRRAGGNPYFLWELARFSLIEGITDEVPVSLKQVVANRVSGIGRNGRHILEAAALLGSDSTITRVRALLRLRPLAFFSALEEIESSRLVTTTETVCRCRHEIVRTLVLSRMLPSKQQLLRLRAARLFTTEGRATKDPSLILIGAKHLTTSGRTELAARGTTVLARRLLLLGATGDAARLAAQSELLASDDVSRRRALAVQARALRGSGHWEELANVLERYVRLDRQPSKHSAVELLRTEASYYLSQPGPQYLESLLTCVRAFEASPTHRCAAAMMAAVYADHAANAAAAIETFETVRVIEANSIRGRVARTTAEMVFQVAFGCMSEARRAALDLADLSGDVRTVHDRPIILRRAAECLMRCGELDAAADLAARALELARRCENARSLLGSLVVMARVCLASASPIERIAELLEQIRVLVQAKPADPFSHISYSTIAASAAVFLNRPAFIVATGTDTLSKSTLNLLSRPRAAVLATVIASSIFNGDPQRYTAEFGELRRLFQSLRMLGDCDFMASVLAAQAHATGIDAFAIREELRRYVSNERRDKYELPLPLKEFASS